MLTLPSGATIAGFSGWLTLIDHGRDEEGTWLAREKQKRKRSYLLCGAAFLTVLIMGIGIGALVTVVGNRGS